MKQMIDRLFQNQDLSDLELVDLINNLDDDSMDYLFKKADERRQNVYGKDVYMRGLIEFTNFCKNDCTYCGIRRSNKLADRYRLSIDEILECCEVGYELGYRTFVLQGGEDSQYTDEDIVSMIKRIKEKYKDIAITLSIGEKPYASYQKYYDAGADRYLLRHETSARGLYEKLHPKMSYDERIQCLYDLKKIGYQIGAGFMVGLPDQTTEDLVSDLRFLKELQPQMVGIGPFIPHKDTPLANEIGGDLRMTTILLAIIRLMLPGVLLPATTALGSISPQGREKGLKAGANVVMPNLSPTTVRDKYLLYDGKICTGDEAAHCRGCIEKRINSSGFQVNMSRGDHVDFLNQ
jgi:biotin synthase